MKKVVLIASVIFCCGTANAVDQSEMEVPTSPLKIYSGGISVGVVRAVSDELRDEAKNMFKLSYSSSFSVRPNLALFLDVDYLLPDDNYGADIGFDFIFYDTGFRPFAGLGVGGHRFDHGGEFSNDFGPSLTAHIGFSLDLADNVAVRFRAPYHVTINDAIDHTAGIDVAFIFWNKHKNVKKLNYN